MSFRSELWAYVKTNYSAVLPYDIYYGYQVPAGGVGFYSMAVISDDEQPEVICEGQGGAGNAVVRFIFSVPNTESNASLGVAEDELEKLKNLVKNLRGDIGSYIIWGNTTSGVQSLGDPDNQWWACSFDCQLQWNNQ